MTDELKIFGKAFGDKKRLPDEISERRISVGIFQFTLQYHCEWYPDSPYHGVTGSLSILGAYMSAASFRVDNGRWLGTESEVVAWLESEARRIMRECLEIAGPMFTEEPCGIGPDGEFVKRIPVRF